MKNFDTELKKYADKVQLKMSERRELRERVLSYMEYHPLQKQTPVSRVLQDVITSESFVTFRITKFYMRLAGSALVLMLIVSPFIAEQAVPGDALYFVKTGFNESVQKQFMSSPYEKIEFETKLIERRISEARTLANEGKLTDEVKIKITETVKGHTNSVQNDLTKLRTQDADGAAIAQIAFNSSLEVQSAVLGSKSDTASSSSVDTILLAVNEARERVTLNQGEQAAPSFDGLNARIERETTRAYELFTAIKNSATSEEIRDIERRLSDINRLTIEAKDLYSVDPGVSTENLIKTLGLTQKLIVFMTNIDVRKSVSLDSLLPIVLSNAERVALLQNGVVEARVVIEVVTVRLETIGDSGVKEKVTGGLAQVEDFLTAIDVAIADGDIAGAENLFNEVDAFVRDLDNITQHTGIGIMSTEEEDSGEVVEGIDEVSRGALNPVSTSTEPIGTTTRQINTRI